MNRIETLNDFNRIMNSDIFSKLQDKTQLILFNKDVTNRFDHSHQVVKAALILADNLQYTKNLSKVHIISGAIAHDIGHPPFGHDGEKILNFLMKSHGGFESNAQALHILSKDLKVTNETIAAVFKHTKEIPEKSDGQRITKGYYSTMRAYLEPLSAIMTDERSIIDFADEICYTYSDFRDLFFITKLYDYHLFSKSTLKDDILCILYKKFKHHISWNEFKYFIDKMENILQKNNFHQYVYTMCSFIFMNDKQVLEANIFYKIITCYVKLLIQDTYFKSEEFLASICDIHKIMTKVFHYLLNNNYSKCSYHYRSVCDNICKMNEIEIIELYRQVNK